MMTFDEAYIEVEKSSHETAFNRGECEALWNLLGGLAPYSKVVEIGVEFGRSTTIIGIMANVRLFDFTAVDNWSGEYGQQAREHVNNLLITELGLPIKLKSMDSALAAKQYPHQGIDLLHIDGDHEYESVKADIGAWTPKVKKGGFICFDDYGHDSLPGVYRACEELMTDDKYDFEGRYGDKLGVYRKK